jgi:hypothetical protein
MRTSLHSHKAITGSVAAFALGLCWVIPAATAGAADPTQTVAGGIDGDVIPVEVEGQVLFTYYDNFEGEEATGHTEASILLDDGRRFLVDDDVTEADDLVAGDKITATLLIPAETAEQLSPGVQKELVAVVEEAAPAAQKDVGIEPLSASYPAADALLDAAAAAGDLVPLSSGYYVVRQTFEPPTASDYNRVFDVAVITPDGTFDGTDQQIRAYVEATEEIWRTQTGKPFNFTVSQVKRSSTTVVSTTSITQLRKEAAALFGHYVNNDPAQGGDTDWYHAANGRQLFLFVPGDEFAQTAKWSGVTDTLGTGVGSGGVVAVHHGSAVLEMVARGDYLADFFLTVPAHELGHVFGLDHATTRICSSAPRTATWNEAALGTCTLPASNSDYDYEDDYSLMGHGATINPTLQYELGLLASSDVTVIDGAVSSQTVTLNAPGATGAQKLLIVSSPDQGIDYAFEYRVVADYDDFNSQVGPNGVRVLRLQGAAHTYLYEATPGGSSQLPVGETFISADGKLQVKLVSQTATQATLSVTRLAGDAPWAKFEPTLVSPEYNNSGHTYVDFLTNVPTCGVPSSDSAWITFQHGGECEYPSWVEAQRGTRSWVYYGWTSNSSSTMARHGIISMPVTGENGQTVTAQFHVFQSGTGRPVTVTPATTAVSLLAASGSAGSTAVTASQGYWWIDETTLPDWLGVSPWWGASGTAAVFTAKSANTASGARSASVAVVSPAGGSATITVTQAAQGSASAVVIPAVSVTGTATVGYTVRAVLGATTPSNATKVFQWYRGSTLIQGATGDQYALVADDAGKQIKVRVTASASGYTTATRDSDPVTVTAASLSLSQYSAELPGVANTSSAITVTTNQSSWTVADDQSWLSTTKSTSSFTVTVTANTTGASRTGTITVTAGSAPAKTVAVTQLPRTVVFSSVTVSGTFAVGQTLTAQPGASTPTSTSKAYQWYRGSTEIPGATASTYTLTAADVGYQVKVKVTASASGYVSASAESTPQTVAAATLSLSSYAVQFTSAAASTSSSIAVTTNQATWSWKSSDPTWLSVTKSTSSFTVRATENTTASARTGTITISAPGAASRVVTVTQVGKPTVVITGVTVSGTFAVGQRLTAQSGVTTPTTTTKAYQWYRGSTLITNATASTYTLTATDVGYQVKVKVTASASGYISASAESTPTLVEAAKVSLSPTSLTLSSTAQSTTVAVTTNQASWSVTDNVTWLTTSKLTSSFTVTVTTNTLAAARMATVTVTAGTAKVLLTVTQNGATPTVQVSTATVQVAGAINSYSDAITVTTNQSSWIATTTTSWLTLSRFSGTSGTTFMARAIQANTTGTARTGTITVSAGSATPKTVTVTQAPQAVVFESVSVSGTPVVGHMLTAKPGASTPVSTTKVYQWYRGSTLIPGATGSTYTLVAADAGQQVKVRVTASASGYVSATAESAPVAVTVAVGSAAGVGGRVVASDGGSVTGWQVRLENWSCSDSGNTGRIATETAYATVAADGSFQAGANTTGCYRMTVIHPGGTYISFPWNSGLANTGVVAAGSRNVTLLVPTATSVGLVSVTGTATVGSTLTAVPYNVVPSGASKAYQWLRNGSVISGATGTTYKVTANDVGRVITVRLTATHSSLGTATKTSEGVVAQP